MPKKYYRPRIKYSVEQSATTEGINAGAQTQCLVVPPAAIQGMRKVKHLTVTLSCKDPAAAVADPFFWALVYCPEGVNPGSLTLSTVLGQSAPLYEPNQYVMNCGVLNFSAGPTRISSHVSRNLNSGDRIYLIIANPNSAGVTICAVVRYAISLH